eukprot:13500108-Heterocapsa_arctica.AAC.1
MPRKVFARLNKTWNRSHATLRREAALTDPVRGVSRCPLRSRVESRPKLAWLLCASYRGYSRFP